MAQSRKRAGGAAPSRTATRSESKKPAARAAAAPVEIVEEEKGMGIDDGIILLTTIALLAAFLMLDYHRGKHYGEGMLFAGSYQGPVAATPAPAPAG